MFARSPPEGDDKPYRRAAAVPYIGAGAGGGRGYRAAVQTRRDARRGGGDGPRAGPENGHRPAARVALAVAVAVAVAAVVALRFVTRSDLWLDEALSVNIASLPAGEITDAVRHDGHPPLYYLLLHSWRDVVGEGDVAVRSLSGVLSVATLPLAWFAGRRYAGRQGAVLMLLLTATSPFAVRYATEARMYSLVMLLVVAGWLGVRRALEKPSPPRLALVGFVAGLLLLTHYWAFYLVAATAAVLAWQARASAPARRVVLAVCGGAVLFVPWIPGFLDQLGDTGTPWGRPDRPATVVMVSLADFGGGAYAEAQVLGIALAALAVIGLAGRSRDRLRLELDLRTLPPARPEAAVVAGTVALAVVASWATGSAFATRYMATVLPLVLLVATLGVTRVAHPGVRAGLVVALVTLGAVGMARNVVYERTQGGEVARAVNALAAEGDLVAFCPDQLGPATARYLRAGVDTSTYPQGHPPDLVDWVDYEARVDAGDPVTFASSLLERAGSTRSIWLVWFGGYRTHDHACEELAQALGRARPVGIAVEAGDAFEPMWLHRYPPG
jgi:mannosyltransferase